MCVQCMCGGGWWSETESAFWCYVWCWNALIMCVVVVSERVLSVITLTAICTYVHMSVCAQRINHFPGMGGIARKDSLARNIQKYVS